MAKIFDARDPGVRIMIATAFAVLCMALAMLGARFAAAAEVEVNLDVLKTLPAGKSGEASKAIELTPPTAKKRNAGRREEALRRARKKRLIEQAKRKAAARKKAEAARKAAEAKRAEEAKQSQEIERKAKADREDAAARAAKVAREAEAAKKAEAKAAKSAEDAKAAKAAADSKAAKARSAKPAVVPQKAPVTEAAKAKTKPKAGAGGKKQIATRTARLPIGRARLLFGKESAALGNSEKEKLETIAARMISEEKALLVIYAYAAGDGTSSSEARRLSLSRALTVRRAITGRGIPAIRTEIRALGARAGTGPSDRVDLVLVQR